MEAILEINPSHNVVKAGTAGLTWDSTKKACRAFMLCIQALKNNMETKPDAVETEDMAS